MKIASTFVATAFLFVASGAFAQTSIPYKAVWYQGYRASLAQELADTSNSPTGCTTSSTHPCTPRQAAIYTLADNFNQIANTLHANAVIISLGDDDDFWSEYGGGFPYDPDNNGKPQRAVGQEIILDIASHYGLKVVFAVRFSPYHVEISDTSGSNPPSPTSPGAYQFIHALIDPTAFYCGGGCPQTTDLDTMLSLSNTSVRSYYNDSRVAGWLFGQEWCVDSATCGSGSDPFYSKHSAFINKYWQHFYNLVHYGGSTTGFAGIYINARPDECPSAGCATSDTGDIPRSRIDAFKALFNSSTGFSKPDQFGLEWYGDNWDNGVDSGAYNLNHVSTDLTTLAYWLMNDGSYAVSYNQVMFGEGGTLQADSSSKTSYYQSAISTMYNIDGSTSGNHPVATAAVWAADIFMNLGSGSSGFSSSNYILYNPTQSSFAALLSVSYSAPTYHVWSSSCGVLTSSSCYSTGSTLSAQYGTFTFSNFLNSTFGSGLASSLNSH